MDSDLIANAIDGLKGRDWFDYFIGTSTVVISACTLIVALFIGKKLSLKGRLLEKQLETVFKLVDTLQNTTLHIGVKGLDDMPNTTVGHFIRFFELARESPPKLANARSIKEKLLFSWKGWDELIFTAFADNPYTPSEIAKAIAAFKIEGGLVKTDDKQLKQVVSILSYADYGPGRKTNRDDDDSVCHDLWHIDGQPVLEDFTSFHSACTRLKKEIDSWLTKYEADGLNLK